MKKIGIFSAVAAAVTLTSGVAFAKEEMEKCKVVKDGKGLIKENKSDCAGANHSFDGQNKGKCTKINAGELDVVDNNILNKIEVDKLKQ